MPAPNGALRGLGKVNVKMLSFVRDHLGQEQATLDMDATLVATHKQEALYCYQGYKAYQPLVTYWAEADLVVHSEFRDGNVPAGFEQLRVLRSRWPICRRAWRRRCCGQTRRGIRLTCCGTVLRGRTGGSE